MFRNGKPIKSGLYDPAAEKDSCGVGFVAHIKGRASNTIIQNALTILQNMHHRGACGCDENSGDGAGILTTLPHPFLERVARTHLREQLPEPGRYVLGDKLAVDMDSNGWPQARRDEVLRLLRRCSAFHIAGDQHLATVVRHGIDAFGDAGYSFTGPALNNIWPRRWWPTVDRSHRPLPGRPKFTKSRMAMV